MSEFKFRPNHGYLNPALNNPAQVFIFFKKKYMLKTKNTFLNPEQKGLQGLKNSKTMGINPRELIASNSEVR